ncbi:DUF2561 family protein [Mycobacterium gastri]|uniref:DUF2561 domain-containing protein n=1 Tax=Mycobacterium gastri TaxID=1777 RepID=A0A1X1VC91_MYCGS|nr:DUF2561 family protein [Mycobacterium gastri]ETW22621.1 membrane protein [Mycobacterium gastri 'Wayne']ORV66670.1 hypothetical protein AWC07_10915 [Mycobacterium gastri]
MLGRYSAYRRGPDGIVAPAVVDRILIGACAAVWLVLVGVSVAAAVALADLGRGFHKVARDSRTTWVLYAVIIISALIIAGAIPVLLRARRMSGAESAARPALPRALGRPPAGPGKPAVRTVGGSTRRDQVRAFEAAAERSREAVDRIWLRGTVALTGAIGTALIGVALATYLMAVGHDGPSWVSYGAAAVITAGMPAIEWYHVRQLRRVAAER